jgi:hypothetical protein
MQMLLLGTTPRQTIRYSFGTPTGSAVAEDKRWRWACTKSHHSHVRCNANRLRCVFSRKTTIAHYVLHDRLFCCTSQGHCHLLNKMTRLQQATRRHKCTGTFKAVGSAAFPLLAGSKSQILRRLHWRETSLAAGRSRARVLERRAPGALEILWACRRLGGRGNAFSPHFGSARSAWSNANVAMSRSTRLSKLLCALPPSGPSNRSISAAFARPEGTCCVPSPPSGWNIQRY